MAGPRVSQTPPEEIPRAGAAPLQRKFAPEMLASLTYRHEGSRLGATYTRSQFIGFGAAGFIDTESFDVRAATVIGSRLQLSSVA